VLAYVVRRILQMVFVVLGVVTVTFVLLRLTAGDPASLMVPPLSHQQVLMQRERLGTDKPIAVQYVEYLGFLARGNLGYSFHGGYPVRDMVFKALPNTLMLGALSIAVAWALGLLLGIISALRPNSLLDRGILLYAVGAQSVPNFGLGIILVLIFAVRLQWLPAIDLEGPESFVLPVATLVVMLSPMVIRNVRQSFLETMGEDFMRAVRARGLSELRVLLVHGLMVAAIPLVTLIGLQVGFVLGGSYVVESIFNWPGIGKVTLDAIASRDFPTIQGGVLVAAIVFVLVNFVVDLLYAAFDPRIRSQL
jgi:peptide/nickel transport system permease protein